MPGSDDPSIALVQPLHPPPLNQIRCTASSEDTSLNIKHSSSENQPRRNEEREGFFWSFLRPLRFFVVGSHCFMASQRDMSNSSENQPRRNEEREGFFWPFLRPLRFFVVDFHCFMASQRDVKAPQKTRHVGAEFIRHVTIT
jgi:hypothetical protein